jgi:MerR family transcriptional regulator/heat shock protein HspR
MGKHDSIKDDPVISIGTVAEKLGLSVSCVRKYESEGFVLPYRTESGRRLYSHEDVDRIRYIQYLIQKLGLNFEGIRRMQALLPCWSLLPCDKKTRNRCKAFGDNTRPCWMIRGSACARKGNECRSCVVYRFGSMCTEDIKQLLHDQIQSKNSSEPVAELMGRKRR